MQRFLGSKYVEGEISKITDFGAFVKLASGIEGLVHISEISAEPINKIEEVLKVGEKRAFRVIKVNQEEHKLGLSLKPEGSPATPRKAKAQTQTAATTAKPEKTERAEKPRREKEQREAARPASKVKSQLQLELEKYKGNGEESNKEGEE